MMVDQPRQAPATPELVIDWNAIEEAWEAKWEERAFEIPPTPPPKSFPPPTVATPKLSVRDRWLLSRPGVYFICETNDYGVIDNGVVKIGQSRNPLQRMATFQTANRRPLVLEAIEHDDWPQVLEADLHRRFAKDRIHGEWFRVGEEAGGLGEYIDNLRAVNRRQCVAEGERRQAVRLAREAMREASR